MCPWELANNPRVFSIWANINGVIAGPAEGIFLLGDYLLVRRTKVHVSDLYVKGHGLYWYSNGTNWRAVFALFMSIWPMIRVSPRSRSISSADHLLSWIGQVQRPISGFIDRLAEAVPAELSAWLHYGRLDALWSLLVVPVPNVRTNAVAGTRLICLSLSSNVRQQDGGR